ncbi:MAG: aminotransferase class V-fold PLP-dependent enzyme, partial [Calditrichia bacterium]|nr:aminotransferase class V-fold PLP-dependent enzyme [Calditrichia bacterium]
MKIPFVDLKAQYNSIKPEIDEAIQTVINETAFIGGKYVKLFSENFANFIGGKYCVPCANGTDAIQIALHGLGIGEGDEVLVPAMTFIATSESVTQVGAKSVFVDVHPKSYTIDPLKIEDKITKKTKAIIPVHLTGRSADMSAISQIAEKFSLKVIEDCAQATGTLYKGKHVGNFGDTGCFSFYPTKN